MDIDIDDQKDTDLLNISNKDIIYNYYLSANLLYSKHVATL